LVERVTRLGHRAIAVGFGRAVDIAEFRGAERRDRHRDILGRADREAGAHRAEPAPGMRG
jgi:hypothetical protein